MVFHTSKRAFKHSEAFPSRLVGGGAATTPTHTEGERRIRLAGSAYRNYPVGQVLAYLNARALSDAKTTAKPALSCKLRPSQTRK